MANSKWRRRAAACRGGPGFVVAALVLASCKSLSNMSALDQGLHGQYVSQFEQTATMETAPQHDLYTACHSYFEVRHYTKFDACENTYRRRFAPHPVTGKGDPQAYYVGPLNGMAALINIDLGNRTEARERADRAFNQYHLIANVAWGDDTPAYRGQFTTLENVSLAFALLGERQKAQQAITLMRENTDIFMEAPIAERRSAAIARAHLALGNFDEAKAALGRDISEHKAIAEFVKVLPTYYIVLPAVAGTSDIADLNRRGEYYLQFMKGKIAAATGDRKTAREAFDVVANVENFRTFSGLYWQTLFERGSLSRQEGDLAAAMSDFETAMDVAEAVRSRIDQTGSRIGFAANIEDLYHRALLTALDLGRNPQAFEILERAKSRALVDMLASRRSFAAADDATVDLVKQLDDLERQSFQLAATAETSSASRSAELDATRARLRSVSPELASLVAVGEVDARDIQNRLGDDEVLLAYHGHDDVLVAFVVTRTSVEAVTLDGTALVSGVSAFRRAVQAVRSEAYKPMTTAMYDRLVRPVASMLARGRLTIVPDGPLHYLPFAALHDGSSYLIDRYELRLLPSSTVLRFLNKRGSPSQDLLALGNPDLGDPRLDLPGAQEEARAIARSWAGSRVLLRKVASEANFKKFAPSFRYLHLASHGEFNAETPLQSRMLLTPGEDEDGNLRVNELYDLRLNAELVTLSACETGLGDVRSGDDVIGLSRGFLYAGANSIVASLWPVSDEATAYLMQAFYESLKATTKASALKRALLATKEKFPHPVFWSSFNLIGAV